MLVAHAGSTEVRRHRVGWPLGWRRFQSAKTKATYRVNWRFFFFFFPKVDPPDNAAAAERKKQKIEGVKQVKGWHKRASNRMLFSCVRVVRVCVCVCVYSALENIILVMFLIVWDIRDIEKQLAVCADKEATGCRKSWGKRSKKQNKKQARVWQETAHRSERTWSLHLHLHLPTPRVVLRALTRRGKKKRNAGS